MQIAHDNGVGIVIGGSGALVGSGDELEGSFAEPLLRLGLEFVIDVFLSLAVFSSTCCYRITCSCAVLRFFCHTYEKRISDFGYTPQVPDRHWHF